MGDGGGEGVDATLVSTTVTHSRTFSISDLDRVWFVFLFFNVTDKSITKGGRRYKVSVL